MSGNMHFDLFDEPIFGPTQDQEIARRRRKKEPGRARIILAYILMPFYYGLQDLRRLARP